MMLVSDAPVLQVAVIVIGAIFVLGGLVSAYVSFLCINGKIKPNGAAGVRLNFSRNYKLYNQEKYWYDINRYGGKRTLPVMIIWILLSVVAMVLPLDARIKMDILIAIVILVTAALIISGWQIYRYADRLVSGDKAYI